MLDMNEFISECPIKTPPMAVQVINSLGTVVKKFDVPAGFQLDKYASAVHPDHDLMVNANNVDITVSVTNDFGILAIYRGIYI